MVTDHITPMCFITRTEVLAMAERRIESIVNARATLRQHLAEERLDTYQEAIKVAIELMDTVEERTKFSRDHLQAVDHWIITNAQLLEIHTQFEPMDVNWERLFLSADPGKILQQLVHNSVGRAPRW